MSRGGPSKSRAGDIIDIALNLDLTRGGFSVSELASAIGLSERSVRDYLNLLSEVGVLVYMGGGLYRVNRNRLNLALSVLEFEPFSRITLDYFLDNDFFNRLKTNRELISKVSKVASTLPLDLVLDGPKLRSELAGMDPGYSGELLGDRFIYLKAAKRVYLHDVLIPGSAPDYLIRNYGVEDYVILTAVYLSACVYGAYFRNNVVDMDKTIIRVVPDFKSYMEKEPLEYGDPFYEISTDFPDLLGVARKIAARYLAYKLHLLVDKWFLEKYGDDLDVYFRYGDLVPHGFTIEAKRLVRMRAEVFDLFLDVLKLAKSKGVILSSISYLTHDNVFVRNVSAKLGKKIGGNDHNFLSLVLEDGDTTALIYREKEKGRPKVDNWFEFYMKYRDELFRVDFISIDDPFSDYEKVRDLAYSATILSPRKDLFTGPSPVVSAKVHANQNVMHLDNLISTVLKHAITERMRKIHNERHGGVW